MESIEFYIENEKYTTPTIEVIEELVCIEFGITLDQLKSKSRKGILPTARFMLWYLIRKKKLSPGLQSIADMYGYETHSNIYTGINKVIGWMKTEKALKNQHNNILVKLG